MGLCLRWSRYPSIQTRRVIWVGGFAILAELMDDGWMGMHGLLSDGWVCVMEVWWLDWAIPGADKYTLLYSTYYRNSM